jgi:hypothetical protein
MARPVVTALAVLPALLLADPIRAFQQPSFRSRTLGVRVDVLVTDGRKPVGGRSNAVIFGSTISAPAGMPTIS